MNLFKKLRPKISNLQARLRVPLLVKWATFGWIPGVCFLPQLSPLAAGVQQVLAIIQLQQGLAVSASSVAVDIVRLTNLGYIIGLVRYVFLHSDLFLRMRSCPWTFPFYSEPDAFKDYLYKNYWPLRVRPPTDQGVSQCNLRIVYTYSS